MDELAAPGDVWVVRTSGWAGWWIRLGARLRGIPHRQNHVVIVHHKDSAGVWWGIEGRPGGVGWVDVSTYRNADLVTNADQPKNIDQRAEVCHAAEQLLTTEYDWEGIAADACRDLHLPVLFARDWNQQGTPGHVVCSSFAAYVYSKVGLPSPHDGATVYADRWIQPGDWTRFILRRAWQ